MRTRFRPCMQKGVRADRRLLLRSILSLLFLTAIPVLSFAQADISTSTLKGKVTDQNASSVSGASVTVIDVDRGLNRNAVTNSEGNYRIPLLQPGTYEVSVAANGFQPQVLKPVVLTVGQIGVRDFQLQIGQVNEALEITGRSPLVEIERTQQSDTVERQQIASLPNLSRNFTNYISVLPGVADVAAARVQQSRVINIPTSGLSVGAGNGRSNYVSIDGGENDSGTGNLRIRNLSVEAVQEFQVNRNAFAAEYGFTASTAINVITRSGTKNYRGSGYIFYRSEDTSARDAFNSTGEKAFEQRISPGFTVSGPLVGPRTFFFSSFETLKYDVARLRGYTGNTSLLQPTGAQSAYIQTLIFGPNSTDETRRIAGLLGTGLSTTSYPTTMTILRESEGQFTAPSRTYNWSTRIDHEIGARDLITGRYTLAIEDIDLLGITNVEAPSNGIIQTATDNTAVGTWTHIFENQFINQMRFQFVDDDYRQVSRSPGTTQIVIAGLMNYGHIGTVPFTIDQRRYQIEDTLSWSHGSKDFKVGASYRPVDALLGTEIGFKGTYQFAAGQLLTRALSPGDIAILTGPLAPPADTALTSLQAFNLGLPSLWQQGFGNPSFRAWQHNFGAFGQMSWKAASNLTLNLGARLNYDGEPEPMDRNISLSPRLGFAWDPFRKGKTVIRGGFGTFYAPVSLSIILSANLQRGDGQFINIQNRTLADGAQSSQALWAYGVGLGRLPFTPLSDMDVRAFGIVPAPGQPGRRVAEAAADYDNPYSIQASLGISHQFGRDLVLDVAYQMFRGVHLPISMEGNYRESGQMVTVPGMPGSDLFGPRLARIDPSIAQLIVHSSEASSTYHGMSASLLKRFGRRMQLRASYAYSKALDNTTDFNGSLTPYIPTRRYLDWGNSSFDLRHNFVFSGTFESPFDNSPGKNWAERALADITLSPIITMRSGFPFNLFIGRDVNGDLNTGDRPFYAPRNSGIGENYYNVDLRLTKRFFFGKNKEGASIDFVAEASNLLNRVNYLRVNDVVCGIAAQPGFINGCDPKFLNGPFDFRGIPGLPPTAPLGFVSAAPARQIQFGFKFEI
ncbi:MAG TPA: carboxypeptidase-like regulatory domain-containing protein [Pyrinomonadaceae bacterium]|nr:carboxypeptidase-like regulatory domain-containing protein [Pyrinomonadaceae bacterium]